MKVLAFARRNGPTREPAPLDMAPPIASAKQPKVVPLDWLRFQSYFRWRKRLWEEREKERLARKDDCHD
jgi:hypothetical protein